MTLLLTQFSYAQALVLILIFTFRDSCMIFLSFLFVCLFAMYTLITHTHCDTQKIQYTFTQFLHSLSIYNPETASRWVAGILSWVVALDDSQFNKSEIIPPRSSFESVNFISTSVYLFIEYDLSIIVSMCVGVWRWVGGRCMHRQNRVLNGQEIGISVHFIARSLRLHTLSYMHKWG